MGEQLRDLRGALADRYTIERELGAGMSGMGDGIDGETARLPDGQRW